MSAVSSASRPGLYWAVQLRRNRGVFGLGLVVVAFLIGYATLFPGLLTLDGFAKFSQTWFPLALTAMAQAILMVAGGISLAMGATVSLGAVVAATTMGGALGVTGGTLAVAAVGLGVGLLTGLFTVVLRLPAIIVTLASSFVIGGVALLVLPRPGGSVPAWVSDWLAGSSPTAFGLLVVILFVWKLYAATPLGLALYAAGENPVGAYRSGAPVSAALIGAFGISSLLAALAGLFVAVQTGSGDPVIGQAFTLNSIAAAVLGGVSFSGGQGTMRGAVLGSLLLTVMINVMFFLGLPPVAQYIAQGLIIVAAVALPQLNFRRPRAGRIAP